MSQRWQQPLVPITGTSGEVGDITQANPPRGDLNQQPPPRADGETEARRFSEDTAGTEPGATARCPFCPLPAKRHPGQPPPPPLAAPVPSSGNLSEPRVSPAQPW